MENLFTIDGKEVKTYRDMYNAMMAIDGSCSRGRQTVIGDFILNGELVVIYHHWSNLGFQVYTDQTLTKYVGVVSMGEWVPWLDENGNQQKEHGMYDLTDCEISILFPDEN